MLNKHFIIIPVLTLAAAVSTGCKDDQTKAEDQAAQSADAEALNAAATERDSLIALFNDIAGDMQQIKAMESIVAVPSQIGQDGSARTITIRDDIQALRISLQERRTRLDELEKKLAQQSGKNSQLSQMITNLRSQIEQNEATIASLTDQLAAANITISELNTTVDSLNVTVADAKTKNDALQQQTEDLTNEINKCYYVIGSNKELKEHKIIEKGFLRKTKIMQGDYELSYFTRADKRTLTQLPAYSKKLKVWSSQPKDSYTITTEANGNKVLKITNPSKFWAASNYLIIQTD